MSSYTFELSNPQGFLVDLLSVSTMESARKVNGEGALTLTLPTQPYLYQNFVRDMPLVVHRIRDDGGSNLVGETVWFLRGKSSTRDLLTLTFEDAVSLLKRRLIPFYAEETQTELAGTSDNLIRKIVRDNFLGTTDGLGSDTGRDVSTYLTVEVDLSLGPSVETTVEWQGVKEAVETLLKSAEEQGTYLALEMVPTTLPGQGELKFNFVVRKNQRGTDRRIVSGNGLQIGPDFGNLTEWEFKDDWAEEKTLLYVGGEGDEFTRLVVKVSKPSLIGASPFGRIEGWADYRTIDVSSELTDAGQASLANLVTKTKLTAKLLETDGFRYGVDIFYGDYVTAQVNGQSFDCRLETEHINWSRDEGDELDLRLEGALVSA